VEFYSKNKLEKLVHVVGFITRISEIIIIIIIMPNTNTVQQVGMKRCVIGWCGKCVMLN